MPAIMLLLLMSLPAQAAAVPHPGSVDPRIQTIHYDPDQVVLLRGTLGYQFMLEFAPGEHIDTVSIGDALGWQVTPNRRADVLFLKPITKSNTNLTVLTDERHYAFELRVEPRRAHVPILYIARMIYPAPVMAIEAPPKPDAPPVVANYNYTMTGSNAVRPVRVFDDGKMTYFEWSTDGTLPAIFAVSATGSESLVNYVVRGPYVVVDQLAQRFSLRNGKDVVTVDNRGYRAPPKAALAQGDAP